MSKRLHIYNETTGEAPAKTAGNTGFYQDITEAEKWGQAPRAHPAGMATAGGMVHPCGGAVPRVKIAALARGVNTPVTRSVRRTLPGQQAAGKGADNPPGPTFKGGDDSRGDDGFGKRLGLFLSAVRGGCGLTQRHVGRVLGVSFQQVQKFEYGHNRLSVLQLLTLCRLYEVPMYFIDLLGCGGEAQGLAHQALALRRQRQAAQQA